MINFKKVTVKNFLSVGNEPIGLNISDGLSIILGENKDKNRSNGSGKCVRGSTKVDIMIDDPDVLKEFQDFIK